MARKLKIIVTLIALVLIILTITSGKKADNKSSKQETTTELSSDTQAVERTEATTSTEQLIAEDASGSDAAIVADAVTDGGIGDEAAEAETTEEATTEATEEEATTEEETTEEETTEEVTTDEGTTGEVTTEEETTESAEDETDDSLVAGDRIDEIIAGMTLEQKVAQLFIINPEQITPVQTVIAAGTTTKNCLKKNPVGGFVYASKNMTTKSEVQKMLNNTQTYSDEINGFPMFLCVQEEGGSNSVVAGSGLGTKTDSAAEIGATYKTANAKEAGETIGEYLSELGFNMDLAPVADVLNSDGTYMEDRCFGSDPDTVSEMAVAFAGGLEEHGITAVYKYFPGQGFTVSDPQKSIQINDYTYRQLNAQKYLEPYKEAILEDAQVIMITNAAYPYITGDEIPSCLSKEIITADLREKLGYDGLIMTDAMNVSTITKSYTSAEAAVQAIYAGADVVLLPDSYSVAYSGVLKAVQNGDMTEERIDESVRRILEVKLGE